MTANRRPARKGLAIVPALVCLLLVTLLCAALLKQSRTRRDSSRDEQRRMQAEWLAESGAERAAARLSVDPEYRGETWEIPAGSLGGDPGRVTIAVEAVKDRPGRRSVRVEADYPPGREHRARHTQRRTVELRTRGD
jgi:hypothetical protein